MAASHEAEAEKEAAAEVKHNKLHNGLQQTRTCNMPVVHMKCYALESWIRLSTPIDMQRVCLFVHTLDHCC